MRWALTIAVIALAVPAVYSASIISPSGQFYDSKWNGAPRRINGDSSHFFDRPSADSVGAPQNGCNIGYYITGDGGACGNQPGGVDRFAGADYNGPDRGFHGLPSLGDTAATNQIDVSFAPESPNFVVQLMAEASSSHASNVLGVYSTDTAGNIVATLVLFAGSDTPGKTVQFSPGSGNWGFFFLTGAGSYYTERLLGDDASVQHFAIFRDAADASAGLNFTKLWIGVEESPASGATADYNDMIFTLACVECGAGIGNELMYTPEPRTWLTFATGATFILALSARRRRRCRAASR